MSAIDETDNETSCSDQNTEHALSKRQHHAKQWTDMDRDWDGLHLGNSSGGCLRGCDYASSLIAFGEN